MRRGVRRGPRPRWSFRLLRLTDVKLPLDHEEGALKSAILGRLKIPARDLVGFSVFRRATDARKRGAIALTYTLDIEVADEAALLKRFAEDRNLSCAPDMNYRFVTRAPAGPTARPVVVGAGPCGLFAGLVLAQMGFCPLILERGKVVREPPRTPGACGAAPCSTRNPTCSSARAGPACFPTASSRARSGIPAVQVPEKAPSPA